MAACKEPGASVAAVALAHGVNANLVHDWRRREAAGKDTASPTVVGEFIALPLPAVSLPQNQVASQAESPLLDMRVELRRGPTKIVVSWPMVGAREFGGVAARAAQVTAALIQIEAVWLATAPLDMRARV